MRLDFNILWVEDQQLSVFAQRDAIDRRIRGEGFRLQTQFASSVEDARQYLKSDIYGDHIDLVLMDYDLGAGDHGDDGLIEVRSAFPYKDIVFYSAQTGDLARLVADKRIEGVFCSDRTGLPDEVLGLFGALVKKVLDIDHARGIVMGSSSDIDGLIYDCLAAHFSQSNDNLSEDALKIIRSRLVEIRERFDRTATAVNVAIKVADLHDHHAVYTSIDRLNLLRKLLDEMAAHKTFCSDIKPYAAQTVPRRNDLAHVRVKKEGFSRKLYDRKGNELTGDNVRELRLELLKHQEALESLLADLTKA